MLSSLHYFLVCYPKEMLCESTCVLAPILRWSNDARIKSMQWRACSSREICENAIGVHITINIKCSLSKLLAEGLTAKQSPLLQKCVWTNFVKLSEETGCIQIPLEDSVASLESCRTMTCSCQFNYQFDVGFCVVLAILHF